MTAKSTQLRERVAFDKLGEAASDPLGNVQTTWSEQFVTAARITPRLGGESVMASRLAGRQPVVITVRSSPSTKLISSDWRARDVRSGKVYNVRAIANVDERHRQFDILAEEGVAT